jgi:hypothetical protein
MTCKFHKRRGKPSLCYPKTDRTCPLRQFASEFCEKRTKFMSLVRLFERWKVEGQFSHMPVTVIPFNLVVSVKAGRFRGSLRVKVKPRPPSGADLAPFEASVDLSGGDDDTTAHVVANLAFNAGEPGLYWFEVFFDDEFVTKIPLNVIYNRVEVTTSTR